MAQTKSTALRDRLRALKKPKPTLPKTTAGAYHSLDAAQLDNVPAELRKGKRFVGWKEEVRDGKSTKIPVDCHTERNAVCNDPATWGTFDEAVAFYQKHSNKLKGVGRQFDDADDIIGIDFDDCLDATERVKPEHAAAKWLPLLNSYSEISPSGKGVKVWVCSTNKLNGKSGRRNAWLNVEMYRKGRYFTITGKRLKQVSGKVESREQVVADLWADVYHPPKEHASNPTTLTSTEQSDDAILERASSAKNGRYFKALWEGNWENSYPSQSEADAALCSTLWFWTGDRETVRRLFGQSALGKRDKWQQRADYQESTLSATCKGDVWRGAGKAAPPVSTGLVLKPLSELLSQPVVPVDYLWEGVLVAGSVSMAAAKSKVGKSTLARNLAIAVARGEPFLGRKTKKGSVVYLVLEERREDATTDFRAMGADGAEDILIAEAGTMADVVKTIQERKPALLVVDPMIRLVRVQDANAYAELYGALGPLIDVARETQTHVLCLHHSSKLAKSDAIDSPLGSTAMSGAVSTLIVVKRLETHRTIQTVQRIGRDMPETVLQFDETTKHLSLGGSREDVEVNEVACRILAFMEADHPLTEREINSGIEGRNRCKAQALRRLTAQGKLTRSGTGKKGDSYHYSVSTPSTPRPIQKKRGVESAARVKNPINTGDNSTPRDMHCSAGVEGGAFSKHPVGRKCSSPTAPVSRVSGRGISAPKFTRAGYNSKKVVVQ